MSSTLAAKRFLAFLGNARYSLDPIWDYRALAAKVLVVSFVPDIGLAVLHDGGWPEALALMVMHVAIWAIAVALLPAFTLTCTGPVSATLPNHNRSAKN